MYSLFTKIFLSFWLVALLVGASVWGAQRFLGASALEQAIERTDAHAATVASLLDDQGMPAVRRWLAGMMRRERAPLGLLDETGHLLTAQPLSRRFRERLHEGLGPGVHAVRPGLFVVVRPVPHVEPRLYLASVVRRERGHVLPLPLWLGLAAIVSGAVCFGLAALITRPVRRLRRAAQALSDGNLAVRVPVHGHDEVAALGRDFNVMADRVHDLLSSQRRLLRDVSHELRSPLARLRVALELARQRGDATTVMDRIEREADRLENLVSEVLSVARLEGNQSRIQGRPVALHELVAAVAQDAAFEAEAAGKHVEMEPVPAMTVEGDPVLLRSAVENVVRNGVRHTAATTAVEMTLRTEGSEAVLTVRDHGPGVPETELGKLFQPFTRVGEARDRASGGFGLGLAISRQAVEAHGGRISAENNAEGGLRVTLCLPLGKSQRELAEPGIAQPSE